jgi:hypothetical protein
MRQAGGVVADLHSIRQLVSGPSLCRPRLRMGIHRSLTKRIAAVVRDERLRNPREG